MVSGMSSDKGIAVKATRGRWKRKPNGAGADPLITSRAPASLIEAIKAKANARNVTVGVIMREALAEYVGNGEGRERVA
jgi:Ribbon-helix-helix protein, copG family